MNQRCPRRFRRNFNALYICASTVRSETPSKSDRDKMIAGVMAAVLATQGTAWASAWALAVGFGLNIFLSNWNPLEKNHR